MSSIPEIEKKLQSLKNKQFPDPESLEEVINNLIRGIHIHDDIYAYRNRDGTSYFIFLHNKNEWKEFSTLEDLKQNGLLWLKTFSY